MSYLASWLYDNLATVSIFLVTVTLIRRWFQGHSDLPPGPRPWPFIGHLHLMLAKDKRPVFRRLREQYGDLVYLRVGKQPIVLVSGQEMIHEILSKRAHEFEGRPQVFTTLKIGQGKGIVNSSGRTWSEHRQFLLNTMRGLGIGKRSFEKNVVQELSPFLQVIKETSGRDFDCRHIIQTAISNVVCSIAFGKRFEYEEMEFRQLMKLVSENMKLVGGTSLVNYFPFLECFPTDPFKCQLTLKTVEEVQKVTRGWVQGHKETLDPENPRDIIDLYLLHMQKNADRGQSTTFDEHQLVKFVGDLFVAGTETTATTIEWALIFLVRQPKVQERLYQEIVSTLGGERTTLSVQDKDRMPYTSATISECQRLADIAPFSVPHSNPEAVHLNGMRIPKGSLVIPFLNSMHHDETEWENPMQLRPERFLDNSQQKFVTRKGFLPFGVGSRCCPGKSLALMELFLFLTTIVQHFRLLPSEEEGFPSLEGHIGVTHVPKHHRLRFVSRSSRLQV